MVLAIIFTAFKIITKVILTRCGDNFCTRFFRKKIQFGAIIVRFLLEGCLELGLGAIITIQMMSEDNFGSFWESVSTCCAFITLICLVIAPIALFRVTENYVGEVLLMQDPT